MLALPRNGNAQHHKRDSKHFGCLGKDVTGATAEDRLAFAHAERTGQTGASPRLYKHNADKAYAHQNKQQ